MASVGFDPPLAGDPRYRSLDVWRGLACLMVVLDHAAMATIDWSDVGRAGSPTEQALRWALVAVTRLALGPSLFFVISGYCIAASVDSLRRKGKPASDFLIRRVWRTFPPYWAALACFAVLTTGLDVLGLERLHRGPVGLELLSPSAFTGGQWLGNLTLSETWRPRFWGGETAVVTRVAWSLCYQEQFYAICFLAAVLAPRRLYRMLAVTTLVIGAVRWMALDCGRIVYLQGLFPIYWHEFAVGLAVYWRLNVQAPRAARHAVDLGLVAMLVTALGSRGAESTVLAAGFGLVLIAVRRWDARLATCPGLGAVRACGRRCYSIYLIHLPACTVVGCALYGLGLTSFWARALVLVPASSALALGCGWLFYRAVESRFLEPPRLAGWRRGRAARPSLAAA